MREVSERALRRAIRSRCEAGDSRLAILRLGRVAALLPLLEATPQRRGAESMLVQEERRTGARGLVRSGAVGDDSRAWGQFFVLLLELIRRDPNRSGDLDLASPPRTLP